jgi:hypothetical protein
VDHCQTDFVSDFIFVAADGLNVLLIEYDAVGTRRYIKHAFHLERKVGVASVGGFCL